MSAPTALPQHPVESLDDAGHALAITLRESLLAVYHEGGAGSATPWPGGLVITNNHVVPGIRATLVNATGGTADAEVVGRDTSADLVALRPSVQAPASFDVRIEPLHIGELVYAIGNPWGERGVLTAGVVLAAGSARRPDGAFSPVRADLRLAPGNSGGPMVDATGRVIGINSMIIGGVAVAIPSAIVAEFVARSGAAAAPAGYDR